MIARQRLHPVRFSAWLALALALSPVACTSVKTFDPSSGIDGIGSDEGIVVVQVSSPQQLFNLEAAGLGIVSRHLPAGENLLILVARPRTYRWSRVDVASSFGSILFAGPAGYVPTNRYNLYRFRAFRFDVVAGRTNYAGLLSIEESGDGRLQIHNLDRSTRLVSELRRDHAEMLQRYPLRWAGPGVDPFLERFLVQEQPTPARAAAGAAMP